MTRIFYKNKPAFMEASGMNKKLLLLLFKMLKTVLRRNRSKNGENMIAVLYYIHKVGRIKQINDFVIF